MRLTYFTCNFYPGVVQFAPQPSTTDLWVAMIAGGGGGMGSEEVMSYNSNHPIPYHRYGGMGGAVMFDTLPPAQIGFNGPRGFWPNHGLHPNQAVFLEGGPTGAVFRKPYYVMGEGLDADHFSLSDKPYNPPGPPPFPHVPAAFSGVGDGTITPFRWTIPGSSGGGIQGDQGCPMAGVGFETSGSSLYFAGEPGSCCYGGGGRGGSTAFGAGAIEQFGTLMGNTGNDPGGGGSGGGLGDTFGAAAAQVGPSGGGGGSWGIVHPPLKPVYNYFCGEGGGGGIAGPNGYAGGRGGHPALIILEL